MITNERQYKITRSKARDLTAVLSGLSAPSRPPPEVHPRLMRAKREAIESQLRDLQDELTDYERLKRTGASGIAFDSFDELPEGLIRARIAAGLSQRTLAERLGLTAQQIQRYEAERYRSASYRRLCDVSRALGIRIRNEILLPHVPDDFEGLLAKVAQVGLDRDFVLERLLPSTDSAEANGKLSRADGDKTLTAKTVAVLERVFGWTPGELMSAEPLSTADLRRTSVRFREFGRRDSEAATLFAAYAGYLAVVAARGMGPGRSEPIPADPVDMRKRILTRYGSDDFAGVLHAVWDLGIAVLPLRGPRTFHVACRRHGRRNAIVLNPRSPHEARWTFDLLHELYHAGQRPGAGTSGATLRSATLAERQSSQEEAQANRFAANVMLDGRAEDLAGQCLEAGMGTAGQFKGVIARVASMAEVDAGTLAHYVAFRLSTEGVHWWRAAADLQGTASEAWAVARNVFMERFAYRLDSKIDRALIERALEP